MKDERCSWMIHNFPRELKNKFAAAAKIGGGSITDTLTYLVKKFLREEYEKTKKEILQNDR